MKKNVLRFFFFSSSVFLLFHITHARTHTHREKERDSRDLRERERERRRRKEVKGEEEYSLCSFISRDFLIESERIRRFRREGQKSLAHSFIHSFV